MYHIGLFQFLQGSLQTFVAIVEGVVIGKRSHIKAEVLCKLQHLGVGTVVRTAGKLVTGNTATMQRGFQIEEPGICLTQVLGDLLEAFAIHRHQPGSQKVTGSRKRHLRVVHNKILLQCLWQQFTTVLWKNKEKVQISIYRAEG